LLPEPEDPKEDPEPMDLPSFDDDLFEDFGNTSNYLCQKKPPTPNPPSVLLDKEFLRKSIKELSAILSTEWLEEIEQSMEEIVILTPPSTIQCKIREKWVDVLYNPMVGSNLMSTSFASDFLDEKPHILTIKCLRISTRTSLKGLGILHDISLHMKDADLSLKFHVFEIPDFDIMIGHPLEKLFVGPFR
jgi:hypothetical protein